MLNRITLIGRLVKDPELRYTPAGQAVANFTLAVDRPFTDQGGQRQTDFIDVVCWRKLAETVAEHLRKGRLAAIEGRLQIRSYQTQDGQKRKAAEVVADNVQFLDKPKGAGGDDEDGPKKGWQTRQPDDDGSTPLSDDDIPF